MEALKASIRNFRGAERADIEACPIALIAGVNGAGKSSIAQAVAAALAKFPIPFVEATLTPGKYRPRFTKTEAKGLVRAGTDTASANVCLGAPANCVKVEWPSCEIETKGEAPMSDVFSSGLLNFCELPEQVRMSLLIDLLNASPDDEDFLAAWKDADLDETVALFTEVTETLGVQGWDGTHKIFAERGAKLKGAWEQLAGTKYGKDKAAKWQHPGFKVGEALTPDERETKLADARQRVETAIAAQAVGEAELATLTSQAIELDSVKEKLKDAHDVHDKAEIALEDSMIEEQGIVVPSMPIGCPHCGGSLMLMGEKIEKHDWAKEDIELVAKQKKAAGEKVAKAKEQLQQAKRARDNLINDHKRLADAPEKLTAAKGKTGSQETLDLARDALRSVENEVEAVSKTNDAMLKHAEVVANQKVIDILSPDGLRRSKLVKACEKANATIREMCDTAGWKLVTIDDELQFRYANRHYAVLSASEQYRVRTVVTLAIAITQGSKVVILDGADVLDSPGRNGLFGLLDEAGKQGIYSIVGMTLDRASDAPDLAEAGLGSTYWVTDGIAKTLAASVKKAA